MKGHHTDEGIGILLTLYKDKNYTVKLTERFDANEIPFARITLRPKYNKFNKSEPDGLLKLNGYKGNAIQIMDHLVATICGSTVLTYGQKFPTDLDRNNVAGYTNEMFTKEATKNSNNLRSER